MTKSIRSLFLIACLVSLSIALPSAPRQPPQSNEPRTLLGKPYRRLWRSSQPTNTPPRVEWTLPAIAIAVAIDSDPNTTSPDHSPVESQHDAYTYTFQQLPLHQALFVNTFPGPASRGFGIALDLAGLGTARLRLGLGRSKRPLRYTTASEGSLRSDQNVVIPSVSGKCDHMLDSEQPVADAAAAPIQLSAPEVESRKPSAPLARQRSERLYDRGEWKSRLSEDY